MISTMSLASYTESPHACSACLTNSPRYSAEASTVDIHHERGAVRRGIRDGMLSDQSSTTYSSPTSPSRPMYLFVADITRMWCLSSGSAREMAA